MFEILIPSSPYFFAFERLYICLYLSAPVGVNYMVHGLAELSRYDSGDVIDLGMASAYCPPISVK